MSEFNIDDAERLGQLACSWAETVSDHRIARALCDAIAHIRKLEAQLREAKAVREDHYRSGLEMQSRIRKLEVFRKAVTPHITYLSEAFNDPELLAAYADLEHP